MARTRLMVLAVVILQLLASESFFVAQASVCGDRILKLISNIQHVTERNEVYRNQKEPLTYKDLVDSYFPSCKRDGSFQKRQCFFDKACWCSQPDGSLIEGTFQQGTDLDCGKD